MINREQPVINGKVFKRPEMLNSLHKTMGWIPGWEHVRLLPADQHRKEEFMANIRTQYLSMGDYVLATLFGMLPVEVTVERPDGATRHTTLLHVPTENLPHKKVFTRNIWPYHVPDGTEHFLMWYTWGPKDGLTDEEITRDIQQALAETVRQGVVEFVWYENTKMSTMYKYSGI
ncbi:hypothetical protein Pelo_1428 [Pelomyxa schiedti]|nr:hypothetical protein Pelo_1428 [Pelomyxa schiedti]